MAIPFHIVSVPSVFLAKTQLGHALDIESPAHQLVTVELEPDDGHNCPSPCLLFRGHAR